MSDTPLHDVIFFPIEKMMRKVKDYTMAEFKKNNFPVTKDQWIILKRVSEINGSTQREIAETTFKDPAALTRILDLLEKKGLVKRMNSDEDRRSFIVELTVDGSRLVQKMTPVVQSIRKKAIRGISTTDQEKLKQLMEKMTENIS